jgi:hypothetical protein
VSSADLLRPDDRELFERVREQLNRRNPPVSIQVVADEIGVSVDDLCRWVLAYKEPRKKKAYQSPRFPAIAPPKHRISDPWADDENRRRQAMWRKQHAGATAALERTR